MRLSIHHYLFCVVAVCYSYLGHAHNYATPSLNYERLSFLEKPVASQIGDTTFSLSGLFDSPLVHHFSSDTQESDTQLELIASAQLNIATQLSNSWTLAASYFGQYQSDDSLDNKHYTDNFAVSLGGVWGTLSIGDTVQLVLEQTRRRRAVGNAFLAFDDYYGQNDSTGVAYIGRYGPSQAVFSIDKQGDVNLGWIFQRPIGNKDYRFSARYSKSTFSVFNSSIDERVELDSNGLSLVADLTYGSSLFDLAVGVEKLQSELLSDSLSRRYISLGAQYKLGVISLSLEGHYGEIEQQSEKSAALGFSYDIARGFSANLGVNHQQAEVSINNMQLLNTDDTSALFSLRYRF